VALEFLFEVRSLSCPRHGHLVLLNLAVPVYNDQVRKKTLHLVMRFYRRWGKLDCCDGVRAASGFSGRVAQNGADRRSAG
jgi:hypothetical protein